MAEKQYDMFFGGNAAQSVDEYLEYRRIVGDDDGGHLFNQQEFENYKKRVLPMRQKHRIFVSWVNQNGMDCKLIGPETLCFCQHRFKEHDTDPSSNMTLLAKDSKQRKVPCGVKGCKCKCFYYVPIISRNNSVKCHNCKKEAEFHTCVYPYNCTTAKHQSKCNEFTSSYTCPCQQSFLNHHILFENKEERVARGYPIGKDDETIYKAMGGLTGFSSLLDGYQRLDPSGIGSLSTNFLNMDISLNDHPYIRKAAISIAGCNLDQEHSADVAKEILSESKKEGESDMDYYERRYQERLKANKVQKKKGK